MPKQSDFTLTPAQRGLKGFTSDEGDSTSPSSQAYRGFGPNTTREEWSKPSTGYKPGAGMGLRKGGMVGLPDEGSRNIEDRRNEPPPPQGEGDDDRVEPTEAQKQEQLDNIEKARRSGTLREYTTKDFQRRPAGPQDDFDFEPRKPLKKGSNTRPAFAKGGKVTSSRSW